MIFRTVELESWVGFVKGVFRLWSDVRDFANFVFGTWGLLPQADSSTFECGEWDLKPILSDTWAFGRSGFATMQVCFIFGGMSPIWRISHVALEC